MKSILILSKDGRNEYSERSVIGPEESKSNSSEVGNLLFLWANNIEINGFFSAPISTL